MCYSKDSKVSKVDLLGRNKDSKVQFVIVKSSCQLAENENKVSLRHLKEIDLCDTVKKSHVLQPILSLKLVAGVLFITWL